MRRIGVLLLLVASPPAFSQEAASGPTPALSPAPSPSATPDLASLAAQLKSLQAEVDRLREAAEAPPPTVPSVRRGSGLSGADLLRRAAGAIRLGGVADAAAVNAQDLGFRFTLPRAALFAWAPVGERITFAGELTALGGGAEVIDADVAPPDRGQVFLQYAAVDLAAVPDLLNVRAGLLAVPLGRGNLLSDESARDLFIRPVDELYLIPTPWFDVGAGLTGGLWAGWTRLEWQAYVLSGPSDDIDRVYGLRNARQAPGVDTHSDKAFAGRITARLDPEVEVGLSGYTGAYSADGTRRLWIGEADLFWNPRPIEVELEGVHVHTDGGVSGLGLPVPVDMAGGHLQLGWRFLEGSPLLGSLAATVRYAFADLDLGTGDALATGTNPLAYARRDRFGAGLCWRPVESFAVRGEYELRTEGNANPVADDRAVLSLTAAF